MAIDEKFEDIIKESFYVGSCRYQPLFEKYFPPRLHTTKEFLHFLENYDKVNLNHPLVHFIYGDATHPGILSQTLQYVRESASAFRNVNTVVLEVCSRKVYMLQNTPLSDYYLGFMSDAVPEATNLQLSYQDISQDLIEIKKLLKRDFNIGKILVMSHVNLPLEKSKDCIEDRAKLVSILEDVCKSLEVEFVNVGEVLTKGSDKELFLEDVLPDGTHYNDNQHLQLVLEHLKNIGLK